MKKRFCRVAIMLLVAILAMVANHYFDLQTLVKATSGKNERDYQVAWCKKRGGQVEYALKDRTRVDCLTKDYAIEFDFAKKWSQAIGQSLHYARLTRKKAGIVLICRKIKDARYLRRLRDNLTFYKINIDIWSIGCGEK